MVKPIEKGGTAFYKDDNIYFEEYPSEKKNTVLNGWIFALFAVYDLFLATGVLSVENVFQKSMRTLKNNLHIFDSCFWSYYDERGTLASFFYHDLHINQLEALSLVTGDQVFQNFIGKWKGYKRSFLKRNYAFFLKAYQKLKNPTPVVIVR